jgi:hypothetical protein
MTGPVIVSISFAAIPSASQALPLAGSGIAIAPDMMMRISLSLQPCKENDKHEH